jgi:hypothetical protein
VTGFVAQYSPPHDRRFPRAPDFRELGQGATKLSCPSHLRSALSSGRNAAPPRNVGQCQKQTSSAPRTCLMQTLPKLDWH